MPFDPLDPGPIAWGSFASTGSLPPQATTPMIEVMRAKMVELRTAEAFMLVQ